MTTPAKYDTATPYLAAYVVLRDGDKVALVLRSNTKWMNGHWGLLAGKVEQNETFTAAAIREAFEEGGITVKPRNLHLKLIAQRHADDSDWVDAIFEATEWEGEAHNAEPHMHSNLDWFDLNALPENTIPAIKTFLEAIQSGKTYLEYGW
jgi:8-oxo-dGTP pyrophosphatase MutT (NUDIX family)